MTKRFTRRLRKVQNVHLPDVREEADRDDRPDMLVINNVTGEARWQRSSKRKERT